MQSSKPAWLSQILQLCQITGTHFGQWKGLLWQKTCHCGYVKKIYRSSTEIFDSSICPYPSLYQTMKSCSHRSKLANMKNGYAGTFLFLHSRSSLPHTNNPLTAAVRELLLCLGKESHFYYEIGRLTIFCRLLTIRF